MIDLDSIFRYKRPNAEKLIRGGFSRAGTAYRKKIPIMRKQFDILVTVESDGAVEFKVTEPDSGEEYRLVHVEDAAGGFVGEVRAACEKALADIAAACFDTDVLKAEQTKRALLHIEKTYGVSPEFLWKKYPDCAAFRRKDNEKWFALIMTVDKSKLGLLGRGNVEIIDLKDSPENVENRLDGEKYLKAYHMNKKHWFTLCLDGSVSDDELFAAIASSYASAK